MIWAQLLGRFLKRKGNRRKTAGSLLHPASIIALNGWHSIAWGLLNILYGQGFGNVFVPLEPGARCSFNASPPLRHRLPISPRRLHAPFGVAGPIWLGAIQEAEAPYPAFMPDPNSAPGSWQNFPLINERFVERVNRL